MSNIVSFTPKEDPIMKEAQERLNKKVFELEQLNIELRLSKKEVCGKKAAWEVAQKETKQKAKGDYINSQTAKKNLEEKIEIVQREVDSLESSIALILASEKKESRHEDSVKNVVQALDNLNAYYITTKQEWFCVYHNGTRYNPVVESYSNEKMKDIILGETGWVEQNDITIKKIARDNDRMFRNIDRSFNKTEKSVLNQMEELRKLWLKPIYDQPYHPAFDILLLNIAGGLEPYKDQLEKLIAYRYVKPEDIFVPNIDSCAKGGSGRDTFFKIIEIIFTSECCTEAKGETFTGTHNGELWGKMWVKVSERNSKTIDYNEFKALTGSDKFRLRKMNENAVDVPRMFTFLFYNNGYHSTIPVTGGGKGSEDRRIEPIFSNTSIFDRLAEKYGKDKTSEEFGDVIQSLQDDVWQNEEEVAKWLGSIIKKHKPEEMPKLLPLHGEYYQVKQQRQKNAFAVFMDKVWSLSTVTNCYAVEELHKMYSIVSGNKVDKAYFSKNVCQWLIQKTNKNWIVKVKDIYFDCDDTPEDRKRRSTICEDEPALVGRPKKDEPIDDLSKSVFQISEFINVDMTDEKGNFLGHKVHACNIKDDLI